MRKRFMSAALAAVLGFSLAVNASAAGFEVEEDELAFVCSSDWGYRDLLLRSNPEGRRQLYNKLAEVYSDLWFSSEDVEYDTFIGRYKAAEINVSEYGLSHEEATEVYYSFRRDNPLYYFASSRNFIMYSQYGSAITYYLCVTVDEDYAAAAARKSYQQQIIDYLAEKSEGVSGMTSRYDIAKYFHDELCRDAEYAYVYKDGNTYADPSVKAHNIIGIITEGKGVCESYSKVYQLLLNYTGVRNVYVTGDSQGAHAWNLVKMDNDNYYNFDVTWDDQYRVIYSYFAKGSEDFDSEHFPDSPSASGTSFQYELPAVPVKDYDKDDTVKAVRGDINEDGSANMRDLTTLQRGLNGFVERFDRFSADLNGDGAVNMKDAVALQRLINGYTE